MPIMCLQLRSTICFSGGGGGQPIGHPIKAKIAEEWAQAGTQHARDGTALLDRSITGRNNGLVVVRHGSRVMS